MNMHVGLDITVGAHVIQALDYHGRMHRALSILLILFLANIALADASTRRPNIIVIITDDAGYADFGFTGCTDFPTPNIDRLAAEGVVCTDGYVSASVCSPSRAGLMTGRYQQRFGHEMNLLAGTTQYATDGLPLQERTIADRLRALGYRTGALGKWHLGVTGSHQPLSRGFDEYVGCLSGSRSFWYYDEIPPHGKGVMRQSEPVHELPGTYFTDLLADEATSFIMRNGADPFLLYLSFTAVHTPMHAQEQDLETFKDITPVRRRKLAAMTASLDRAVGQVLETLSVMGLSDDTLIMFVNDNGGATNNASSNGIYRGMKGSKWEGGIRVPFIVAWPGHLPAGVDYEQPVSTLDILPTAVAAAGGTPDASIDGVNLLPFLDGDEAGPPHERLFWRRSVAAAVREGDWKLIRVEGSEPMLFNLADDPSETTNLASGYPQRVAAMSASLVDWESELAEPRWGHAVRYMKNQKSKHQMDVQGRDQERKYP